MSAKIKLTTSQLESHAESEESEQIDAKLNKAQSIKEGEIRHSNPFLADGVLSRKADYILTHSTITRTELHIADPDNVKPEADVTSAKSAEVHSSELGVQRSTDDRSVLPVEVEVRQTTVDSPNRQRAEEVKLSEKKKCKCCTVL